MNETQIDNPRVTAYTADIVEIAVAPRIEINWDSITNEGTVCFWVEIEEYQNGVFLRRVPHPHMRMRPMVVTLAEVVSRTYTAPMPEGMAPIVVPPPGLGQIVRTVFDDLFALLVPLLPQIPNAGALGALQLQMPEPPAEPIAMAADPLFADEPEA